MTFIPGFRGANITGNTANAGTAITSGTMVLAGGNNITLSQAGNTITISGGAGGGGAGSNTLGMSNLGNTSGTTGVVSGSNLQFAFAGGNNVTLSQSLSASSGTITISAASQSIQTQGLQTVVLNTDGNTSGTTASISSGAMTLAGGNNITLSQSGNAITISAANGGGGGGIAAIPDTVASTFSTGSVNFADAGGALTISASTAGGGGQTINFSVPQTSSLSATGLVSLSTNGSTISVGVADQTVSTYVNMLPASTGSQTLAGVLGASTGSALFFPVSIDTPVKFNALRLAMNLSFVTSTISGQQTISHSFGIYSRNVSTLSLISSNSMTYNATNSSVSATLSAATATGTGGYSYGSITASTTSQAQQNFGNSGLRQIDLQFGNTMSLDRGMYWLGMLRRESSVGANIGLSIGLAGNAVGPMSSMGLIGSNYAALTTNFALKAPYMGFGPYTSTGSAGYGGTALPSSAILSGIAHNLSVLPFMTFIST